MSRMTRRTPRQPSLTFPDKLVLNQWVLSLFEVTRFEELAEPLRADHLQGVDENDIHQYHHVLAAHFPKLKELPVHVLLEYDQNIVSVTRRLNEKRLACGKEPIVWKYFQYLTLLFTEIYLDRYFQNPAALLASLNEHIVEFNAGKATADRIVPYDVERDARMQLNKLAFWCATGAGKTLLMHANILQYEHYLGKHNRLHELNRIILVTPNEGLSYQHKREFDAAGITARIFRKDDPEHIFSGRLIDIIDIHKLKDETGEKTVTVEAFEGNNLVLIDEGHRGTSRGEQGAWLRYRNALCEHGFSFEYSATFGQAVKQDNHLVNVYAKSILSDYSYRRFYQDGFGKDYQIFNIDTEIESHNMERYFVACLLSFFQQLLIFDEQGSIIAPFNIAKPLWIFVGSRVLRGLSKRDASDIITILRFFARYLLHKQKSIRHIERLLYDGLVAADGKNMFSGRFDYLLATGLTPEQIFHKTLSLLFNAPGGGKFHVRLLKGTSGELALHVGDHEPFGVIYVGDAVKLAGLCKQHSEFHVIESDFSGSLFQQLDTRRSPVNVLIGSRKFTEGWNSWRVSTMGLMNIGASEGAQIIQLFGRGVRLKGWNSSLKRSTAAPLPPDLARPPYIELLETLNVFGIRADYMAQFRRFLQEESLPLNDAQSTTKRLFRNIRSDTSFSCRRQKGRINREVQAISQARYADPIVSLQPPDPKREPPLENLGKGKVVVNWYPKIEVLRSRYINSSELSASQNVGRFSEEHVAFLDLDRLYFSLVRFKAESGRSSLIITKKSIEQLLLDATWYDLYIPEDALVFDSFEKVQLWHEVALSMLKKYVEHYDLVRKQA